MENRKGYVYIDNLYAGIIEENDDGYTFLYDEAYLSIPTSKNLSLTMPKTNLEYTSNVLFPFFDNLIPEGWLLNIVSNNWKLNVNDRFGLLLVSCKDPIGNVCVRSEKI